jgi:hypothetical protein
VPTGLPPSPTVAVVPFIQPMPRFDVLRLPSSTAKDFGNLDYDLTSSHA